MPRRTLSPRISTTVTVMSLLITILSFFFLDSTSIGAYPFLSLEAVRVVPHAHNLEHRQPHVNLSAMRAPVGSVLALRSGRSKWPCWREGSLLPRSPDIQLSIRRGEWQPMNGETPGAALASPRCSVSHRPLAGSSCR